MKTHRSVSCCWSSELVSIQHVWIQLNMYFFVSHDNHVAQLGVKQQRLYTYAKLFEIELFICIKMDLALNNLEWLIKRNQTK